MKTDTTREQKRAAAEGLLNHIEKYEGKNRSSAIADIVRYSERIYETAYEDGVKEGIERCQDSIGVF